jgi:hypothetical protein
LSISIHTVSSVTTIIATLATAIVVLAGAPLAFEKLRNRPRLVITMSGVWLTVDSRTLLLARVAVTNASTRSTKLILDRGVRALGVSMLAVAEPGAPRLQKWEHQGLFEIFSEEDWLEPEERVSNELLIDLGVSAPVVTRLETHLAWRSKRRRTRFMTAAQQIVPANDLDEQTTQTSPGKNATAS